MKKSLHKQQLIPLVLFVLIWMFSLPFTAKSQTVWDGTADITWYDAAESSFDISTAEQLAGLAQLVNNNTANFSGKTVNLIADIWLNANGDSTNNWNSIGGYPGGISSNEEANNSGNRYFQGVFNGNYHVINNMYCNRPDNFHAGLFGALKSPNTTNTVKIQNVIIKHAKIRAKGMAGTIAGFASSGGNVYFENCMVINTSIITTIGNNIGGIIGATYATSSYTTYFTNCGVTGDIFGYYPGGFAGNGDRINVTNSYFAGTVDPNGNPQFGGITAYSGSSGYTINGAYSNISLVATTPESRNGTVKTDAYMKSADFLSDLRDTIFKMDCGVNGGYPVLANMVCGVPVLGVTDICNGNSTTLTATSWDSYIWSTTATTASITVNPTVTTTYTVTGTTGGVSITDTVIVNVHNNIDVVGIISPSNAGNITFPGGLTGSYTVPCSNQTPFNITVNANTGYYITRILANGTEVIAFTPEDVTTTYTFPFDPSKSSKWDIQVLLDNRYKINLSSVILDDQGVEEPINGGNLGLITPWGTNGLVWATYGSDLVINFKESARYHLENVEQNATTHGKISSLELNYVTAHHTIKATYADDCGIKSFPFSEGFSSYPYGSGAAFPECWHKLSSNTSYPYLTNAGNSDANSMYFYLGSTTAYCMLITPLIEKDISLLRVSFAFYSTYAAKFEIGVMTDPTDLNSFVSVEELKYTAGSAYNLYTVYLDKYVETGEYIAFKLSQSSYTYAYLDNIVIDEIPACKEPRNLTVSNISGRSALATWQPSIDNSTEYEVEVTTAGGTVAFNDITTKTTMIITGLDTNTNYTVKVRVLCSSTESPWITKDIKTLVKPDCTSPNLFKISDITTTSATASWVEDGTSMEYILEYRETNETNWIQEIVYSYTELCTYSFTGLSQNTGYTVRLRAFCLSGDTTAWSTLTFRTLCVPFTTLPLIENFDNSPGGSNTNGLVPHCWSINVSNTANQPYVGTQTNPTSTDYWSPFGALDFHNAPNTTNIAILPSLDLSSQGLTISDLQVNFIAKVRNPSYGTFILGVMDNPDDATTFTPVDTIRGFTGNNVWREFAMPLSFYKGTGNYIAFMWKDASTYSAIIDNLYIDVITECPTPTSIKIDSTKSDAVYFSWVDAVSSLWEVVCVPAGTIPDWNDAVSVIGNSGSIEGLTHTTQYELYLRTVCVDRSFPVYVSFRTACGSISTLPYVESFDTYGTGNTTTSFPTCWSRSSTTSPYIYGSTSTYHYSPPGGLYFFYNTTPIIASTPKFDVDVSTLQVEFKLRMTNASTGFVIGVMTDPTNNSTFEPVDTVFVKAANSWEDHTAYLKSYTGYGKYIAFQIGGFGTTYYYIYMDDLRISEMGACITPTEIAVFNVTNDEATIAWKENGDATAWEIAYGAQGFNPDNNEGDLFYTSNNPETLTSLAEATMYDVYVRAVCNSGDSEWSRIPASFYTTAIPTELPYECKFEDDEENEKWSLINGEQESKWCLGTVAGNTSGGTKSLYISNDNGLTHAYGTKTSIVYALQTFDFATVGVYEISFDWKCKGESSFDLMRVFLVPSSIRPEAGNAYGMSASTNTIPNGWRDIGGGILNQNDTWSRKTVEFAIEQPTIYHLVVFWKNDDLIYNQPPGAIDNITIIRQPCPVPANLAASQIKNTEATISWRERGDATQWEVQYGEKGFKLGDGLIDNAYDTTHTITGLSSDFTSYDVYVRAVCETDNNSAWIGPIFFRTTQEPVELPYVCDFEDDTENEKWGLINGTQTNKWFIDTAANNTTAGTKALYISNSNGTTNAYSITSTSYVYAARTLDFDAPGVYEIEFDWRTYGYLNYDIMRVFLVPTTVNLEAGNAFNMTASTNTVPSGWIDISGVLCQKSTWQHVYKEVTMATSRIYNFVVFWKNSSSSGSQPPGAIDNISIKLQTCPPPYALTATDVTGTDATIEWSEIGTATNWEIEYGLSGFVLGTGTTNSVSGTPSHFIIGLASNTLYDVYVRSVCGTGDISAWSTKMAFRTPCVSGIDHLPYFESFDMYDNGVAIPNSKRDVIPPCWLSRRTGTADANPYIANWGSGYKHSEPYALDFGYTPTGFSIAIMPEIDASISMTDLQLTFWGRAGNGGNGTFSVVTLEDPNDDATTTVIASYVSPATSYQLRTVSFEDYTGTGRYIAFKWENGNNNSFSLDDVEITSTATESCNPPTFLVVSSIESTSATATWSAGGSETSWSVEYKKASEISYSTPITVTTATYNLTGLTANTDYDVRIRSICGDKYSAGVTTNFKTTLATVITYTITPSVGANGTITPSDPVTVNQGADQTFTFAPNSGYEVNIVKVNDVQVTPTTALSYTFTNVQANATINVTFKAIVAEPDTFVITATAGDHGTINPIDEVKVVEGSSQTFTFIPDQGYEVDSVFVDDVLVASDTSLSYTIDDVQSNMTIHVVFKQKGAIPQHILDNSVLIYPNPVSTQLTIELTATFEQLEITNMLGQVIYTANVNDQLFTISVDDYRSGIYFIRLSGKQGVATKKFVKE